MILADSIVLKEKEMKFRVDTYESDWDCALLGAYVKLVSPQFLTKRLPARRHAHVEI